MRSDAATGHDDRFHGLSRADVEQRRADGRDNQVPPPPSRTLRQIIRANVITPVNGIIATLFVVIMVAAPGPDALFAGVVISNTVLGIAQELRAKHTLDELELLAAPRVVVRRDGADEEIAVDEVVEDDLLVLSTGDQLVVDALVIRSVGLQLDESMLTGESDPVDKAIDDDLLSGSFVVAGNGLARATKVGAESYAASLADEAKRFTLVDSELRSGVNVVLRWLTWIIPPVALVLLWSLLSVQEWREALRGTVAASVAMVPDGLVLLTSMSMIVGVLALARRQALAKELASVELLARVSVLCLDKTGTITTGRIAYAGREALPGHDDAACDRALAALVATDEAPNATMAAIAGAHGGGAGGWEPEQIVPFSSARKWSATRFREQGTWYLGAAEILAPDHAALERAGRHADAGRRVVLLARSDDPVVEERLPERVEPVGLVILEDEVRPDAPEILEFLRRQDIELRVISGDHPATVAAVARRAGVPGADHGVDARTLPDGIDELGDVLATSAVFGRVTPHQKRAMVAALQARGHTVAMTGDGVNDVLALKDSDMGIAMGSGSSASRAVAQLVLLDDAFATLPRALAEGRRVINNIERVANLFIVKATYAVLLAAIVGLTRVPFPFLPRHLTLVGSVSIGIPGFLLALYATNARARPGFLTRVLGYSLPSGIVAGATTYVVYSIVRRADDVELDEARTAATLVLLAIGLVVLTQLSRPLVPSKLALIITMGASYFVVLEVDLLADFFDLRPPPTGVWSVMAIGVAVAAAILAVGPRVVPTWGAVLEVRAESEPEPSSVTSAAAR